MRFMEVALIFRHLGRTRHGFWTAAMERFKAAHYLAVQDLVNSLQMLRRPATISTRTQPVFRPTTRCATRSTSPSWRTWTVRRRPTRRRRCRPTRRSSSTCTTSPSRRWWRRPDRPDRRCRPPSPPPSPSPATHNNSTPNQRRPTRSWIWRRWTFNRWIRITYIHSSLSRSACLFT